MHLFAFFAAAVDLTLRDIVSDIPHDAGTVVFVVMVGGLVFMTWYGSRRSTIDRYRDRVAKGAGEVEAAAEPGPAYGEAEAGEVQEAGRPADPPSSRSRPSRSRARTDLGDRVG
jgi:hypothetical protein